MTRTLAVVGLVFAYFALSPVVAQAQMANVWIKNSSTVPTVRVKCFHVSDHEFTVDVKMEPTAAGQPSNEKLIENVQAGRRVIVIWNLRTNAVILTRRIKIVSDETRDLNLVQNMMGAFSLSGLTAGADEDAP